MIYSILLHTQYWDDLSVATRSEESNNYYLMFGTISIGHIRQNNAQNYKMLIKSIL